MTAGGQPAAATVGPDESPARARILEAACDLIADEGIDDVRIARVANRARVSTALVHHYFSTREELLEQALIHSFEAIGDDRFSGEPPPGASATERLRRAIADCLPVPGERERDWVLWVELWLRAVREPALRPVAAELYRRYHEWLREAIAAGVATGEFSPVDPDALADHAIALLDGFGVRALLRDPAMDLATARGGVAAFLADALGMDEEVLLR